MEQKLCWKCRAFIEDKAQNHREVYYVTPSTHCHHKEPEKKPREKCLCEKYGRSLRIYIQNTMGNIFVSGNIDYCPKCGKQI